MHSRRFPRVLAATLGLGLVSLLVLPAQGSPARSSDTISGADSRIAHSPFVRWMSGPAQRAMRFIAGDKPASSAGSPARSSLSPGPVPLLPLGPNVRVNDPSGDGIGDPDMTTQSEASIAVSGSNVVTGYNDDGRSSAFLKAADDLTGYSWSDDGGVSWHDGALKNRFPGVNLGDPALAADRDGRFYFATLDLDFKRLGVAVAVGRSVDGGKTFQTPKLVSVNAGITETERSFREVDTDKPWITVGRDPADASHDIVYVGWTEFFVSFGPRSFSEGSRIVVSRSLDAGQTWSHPVPVAVVPSSTPERRSRAQFVNGVSLATGPGGGLYVGWEQFVDRNRDFTFATRQEWLARSSHAGRTFSRPRLVASPSPVGTLPTLICSNVLSFGAGRLVRVQEFPALAVGPKRDLFMAYDANTASGPVVRVARSSDGGRTWFIKAVSHGGPAFMPALAADSAHVDVTYYQGTDPHHVKLAAARSTDGFVYANADLSSTSFPVPYTLPPFDPFIAACYMGDYNGAARQGDTLYAAWGDNRDTVVNAFWPGGRIDPDVFFTKVGP
ncbi:MAG: sialidase family protein [Actinomycetota bacterium]